MNERDLAKRIAGELDRGLDELPAGTLYRLRAAREAALARARDKESAVENGSVLRPSHSDRLYQRRLVASLVALVLALTVLVLWKRPGPVPSDYAELDAQVLSDEMPVTAYLDTGFEIWLYHHSTE
jgi:Protein of unknown function (DUF3619)